ncbi:MAG TPA: LLM class flavin-dependent oxidoreductase [Streptosporangiaceae bacterium]|nr:LLM class flavin-dependent oxidoreductase [Streptosporangiaceae bacterium]
MTRLGVWYDFRNPARWRVPWPQLYRETLDQAAYAEELGFSSVWLSEHHFSEEGYLPSLAAVLGALAVRTSRVRLGTAVLLAPLHHPLRLAEDLAVVDQLSGGRLDVGIAPGYKPDEFAVLGVPKAERGARTDETIEILRLAWSGERFSYAGKHFTFDDVIVAPPPAQLGGPPIWIGGSSLAAARRASRYGLCFMPDSGAGAEIYDAYRTSVSVPPRVATNRVLFAAESREKAWEICGPHFLYQFNAYRQWFSAAGDDDSHGDELTDPSVLNPEHYFVGTPDDILAAITASQQRLGYEELVFWARPPGLPAEAATASLELIARHVLPALREEVR